MWNLFVNLSLLLVSCASGLVLCEASLRLFYPKYRDLAEAQFHHHAARIWANNPNSLYYREHPDTGFSHTVRYNNLASRQHRNFSEAEIASAINIGVFGDSFVANIRIPVQYSFTERLDYLLNQGDQRFNVLNFGVEGYGPGQSLLSYEHFRYAADLDYVFFVYYDNDLQNLTETNLFRLDETGRLYETKRHRSSWQASLINRLHLTYLVLDVSGQATSWIEEARIEAARINSRLFDEYQLRLADREEHNTQYTIGDLYRGKLSDSHLRNSLPLLEQILRRWKSSSENKGARFFVVLLPLHPPEPLLVDLLENEDIEVGDLYTCFDSYYPAHDTREWINSPYRFENNDGHWNERGNLVAAVCLYRILEEDMGLPKRSEEHIQETLSRYDATFGSGLPPDIRVEGQRAPSLETAAAIRRKYLALTDPETLREMMRETLKEAKHRGAHHQSVFDVYLDRNQLIFVKEDCLPNDRRSSFFLHIFPVNEENLHPTRTKYGFDNLDFPFSAIKTDGTICYASQPLPAYPIRRIRTGQFVYDAQGNYEPLWEGEFVVEQPAEG